STYSGSSQRMTLATRPGEEQEADDDGGKTDEADLPVGHLRDAPEGVAPQARRHERQHPFEHEHQGQRHEERRAHGSLAGALRLLSSRLCCLAAERVPEVAQEVRI